MTIANQANRKLADPKTIEELRRAHEEFPLISGDLNRSTQHFVLERKNGVCRWIRDFVEGLQRLRGRSYGIGGSGGSSLKAIGRALVSRHRRFISRWLRMGHSSRSATSLEAGIDALGTRGDIERHCDTSIGKIDGWVVGPLTLDGEPRNQLEWRL
ncbi:MAG: hypothetical protein QOE73_2500 [Verrucomicrobiota bacterium]